MISYDEFQAEVKRRKRERWAKILASEPPGRPVRRRPRDPEKDCLLARLNREHLERENPELLRRPP